MIERFKYASRIIGVCLGAFLSSCAPASGLLGITTPVSVYSGDWSLPDPQGLTLNLVPNKSSLNGNYSVEISTENRGGAIWVSMRARAATGFQPGTTSASITVRDLPPRPFELHDAYDGRLLATVTEAPSGGRF